MLIGEIIKDHAKVTPRKQAMICEERHITYAELYDQIIDYQAKLQYKLHTISGKKIAFQMSNSIELVALFLAITSAGGIAVPFDQKWSKRELSQVVDDCVPELFITEKINNNPSWLTWDDFVKIKAIKKDMPNTSSAETEIFYIGYTSGTTGKPKGFMRNHQSWLESFKGSNIAFHLKESDHIFSPGPFVHSHFLYAAIHALHIGATLYMLRKFESSRAWEMLRENPITILYTVPTMFASLTQQYKEDSIRELQAVISAGAKWEPYLKEKARVMLPNASIFEFYGASELSFVSVLDDEGNKKRPETVGKAFPGVEVSIRNEDGMPTERNNVGKLFIKSNQVFSGYVNNPEETAAVIHGEWATVGDLAFMDDEGYITLVGREKNMIISGGLNIYPEEIEKVLIQLEQIDEVMVTGVPDEYWGEKVVAIIKWEQGHKLTEHELKSYCKTELSSYKCPKEFIEVEHFPYTTSGKVARAKVKEMLVNVNE